MAAASQIAPVDVREEDHVWAVPVAQGLPEVEEMPVKATQQAKPGASEIEALAYQLWQERGSPIGSAEEDWLRAEAMLSAG